MYNVFSSLYSKFTIFPYYIAWSALQFSHQYNIPFSFELPASIPSSFEGTHVHIRYEVTAVVDRYYNYVSEFDNQSYSKFTSETMTVCFTVNNRVDLNLNPVAKVYQIDHS